MNSKLIIGIVIGIVLTVVLVLAGVGLVSLLRGQHRSQPVSQSVPGAPTAEMDTPDQTQPSSAQSDSTQIVINGRALTAQQIQQLQALYRVQPRPGNYWYDARSG